MVHFEVSSVRLAKFYCRRFVFAVAGWIFRCGIGCSICLADEPQQIAEKKPVADYFINGKCINLSDRSPLPGVRVRLLAKRRLLGEGEEIAMMESDKAGEFRFENLPRPSELHFHRVEYVVIASLDGRPTQDYPASMPGRRRLTVIAFPSDFDSLKGRVIDEAGKPVEGAQLRTTYWAPAGTEGAPFYETKADGLFLLTGVAATNATERSGPAPIYVKHPDFPSANFFENKVPGSVNITLQSGCTVSGTVVDAATQPIVNVVVSAVPESGGEDLSVRTKTDDNGHFRMCIKEGVYGFVLDDENLVAKAMTGVECRKDKSLELPPFVATEGVWLTGQIVNTKTGEPVFDSNPGDESNEPVAVGVAGPARPPSSDRLAEVDDEGRFRVRVLPGENRPYTINFRTTRTWYDAHRQAPVIVEAGKENFVQIDYTPERTPAELMANAQAILAGLPKETDQRVEAIIGEFRKLNRTVDECEVWCMLMRELVTIGKPAVMPLCGEFEATNEQCMMRRLAFALRAIGDPRAVPSLIRVLPKTLQPPMSDYGLIVNDAKLAEFMRENSIRGDGQGTHFDFGRPVRETISALNKLTGRNVDVSQLASFTRRKDLRSLVRQEKVYYDAAREWADWWEANWKLRVDDPAFSKVNLPAYAARDLTDFPTGLELTKNAATDAGLRGATLTPIGDADHGAQFLADLDSGKHLKWPEDLPAEDASPAAVEATTKWASDHGVDLMCVAQPLKDGTLEYMLVGVGLQLWEIDPLDARNIELRLKEGKLPAGRKLDQPELLHFDAKSNKHVARTGCSFLYLTKDESLGLITITDFITEARDISGQVSAPKGVGFYRGVMFDLTAIAR